MAGGTEIELAWIGLGVGDELRHRLRGEGWMDDQHLFVLRDLGDRDEDLGRIVVAIVGPGGHTTSVLMLLRSSV